MKSGIGLGLSAAIVCIAFGNGSAQALTMQECSAKYNAAKTAGSLNGQKWNDFRKAECGSDAATATPASATRTEAKPAAPKAAAAAPMPSGDAKFPVAVDAKYAKETASKARFKTCVDQYNSNKSGGGNGGLKWIQKGGGYYSECNKRLKGAV